MYSLASIRPASCCSGDDAHLVALRQAAEEMISSLDYELAMGSFPPEGIFTAFLPSVVRNVV